MVLDIWFTLGGLTGLAIVFLIVALIVWSIYKYVKEKVKKK